MNHPYEIDARGKLVNRYDALVRFKRAIRSINRYTLKSRRMYMTQEDYDDILAFK